MPQEKLVNIKLSDIRPNPNRDLKFNPFNEEKITALMASIGETGFWTNVIVRKAPDGKGYEQSYGHHRLEAAKRSGIKEADFVVRDLDNQIMRKMMLLENQEDFRYFPLSLLESVRAVVRDLANGEISTFYSIEDGTLPPEGDPDRYKGAIMRGDKWRATVVMEGEQRHLGTFDTQEEAAQAYRTAVKGRVNVPPTGVRLAPSFCPVSTVSPMASVSNLPKFYTANDVASCLGQTVGQRKDANPKIIAALDALYLLEVGFITTSEFKVKSQKWSTLIPYIADQKAAREREILQRVKPAEEIKKLNEKALHNQAEYRAKEKHIADERAALVKKEAEAKRETDAKKAKAIKERIAEKDEQAEVVKETFKEKKAAIEAKVEEVKQKQIEAKQEDLYLPIRRESVRIIHLLERRDEEEEIKALSRRDINANDRELLRQAAIAKGTWYLDFVAVQFLPPLSAKRRNTKETK